MDIISVIVVNLIIQVFFYVYFYLNARRSVQKEYLAKLELLRGDLRKMLNDMVALKAALEKLERDNDAR